MIQGKRRGIGALGIVAIVMATALAAPAVAQTAPDRRAASDAYERGSRAYLAEDWAQAAHWFEMAYRFAPAAPALVQAVRSHRRAGDLPRAATLAARLQSAFPDDETAQRTASEVLAEAEAELYRVEVHCSDCTLMLDGALLEEPTFYAAPTSTHTVGASFATGDVSATITGQAGQRRVVELAAPPPAPNAPASAEPPPTEPSSPAQPPPTDPRHTSSASSGLSPAFFLTALALTVASAGVLVWSGLDTLAGVDDYEAHPTTEGLANGQAKETRTNILIGVTGGLAAVAVGFLLFTNWGPEESMTPSVMLSDTMVGLAMNGRLP